MAKLADALSGEQVKKMYDKAKPYKKFEGTKVPGKQFERRLPNGMPAEVNRYPEHIVRTCLLARNNAEFKRLLSLLLIRNHKNAGDIPEDAKCYVKFGFNKYSIRIDGLSREYSEKTKLYAVAFTAAIIAFDQYAQTTLANFINNEFKENPITEESLEDAKALTEQINIFPSPNEVEEPEE